MNVQRFRGGHVFKAHRLCVSLNSRLSARAAGVSRDTRDRSISTRRGICAEAGTAPCTGRAGELHGLQGYLAHKEPRPFRTLQ